MKTRCSTPIVSLAIVAAMALPAAGAQAERFGRDSGYAGHGTTITTNAAYADVTRFGRGSAFATQVPTGHAIVTGTTEASTDRYGRASAYATRALAKTIAVTAAAGADATLNSGRM